MKVALISHSDANGGASIACLRLLEALNLQENLEAKMLVQEKETPEKNVINLSQGLVKNSLAWGRFVAERLAFLPYEKSREFRFLFNRGIFGTNLSTLPIIKSADILHLHWINFGLLSAHGVGQLLALGKPVVWTFHDMWAFTGGCHYSGACNNFHRTCGDCQFLKKPSVGDISNSGFKQKQKNYLPFTAVGCSRWVSEKARESSLVGRYRIETIPNPIDTKKFAPAGQERAKTILKLPRGKELILFGAMRVEAIYKGFDYFKKAIDILYNEFPDWRNRIELIVFGQMNAETLKQIPFKVKGLGYITEPEKISAVYNAASMFVTTSTEENLPNMIMESLACGRPAIGFNVGGIPEMIEHKINGYVAEYKSSRSIAEGIAWVLENNRSGQLSRAAREKAETNYSQNFVAKQYRDLYLELLTSPDNS